MKGKALVPVIQVFESAGAQGFRKPVCDQQSQVVPTHLKAVIRDGNPVQIVNTDGNEFNFDAGVRGFKEPSFFFERTLKISVIAKQDAEGIHGASVGRVSRRIDGIHAGFCDTG